MGVSDERAPAPVVCLATHRDGLAHGWRSATFECTCGKVFVEVAPAGSERPACPDCGAPCSRKLDAVTRPDGTPDPHLNHRRQLVGMLEDLLADVAAGRVDGAMIVEHTIGDAGAGWGVRFTGNLDLLTRLGGLEIVKRDMMDRALQGDGPTT